MQVRGRQEFDAQLEPLPLTQDGREGDGVREKMNNRLSQLSDLYLEEDAEDVPPVRMAGTLWHKWIQKKRKRRGCGSPQSQRLERGCS